MKILKLLSTLNILYIVTFTEIVTARSGSVAVGINCVGLPGCKDTDVASPTPGYVGESSNVGGEFIVEIIQTLLQYVAVVAVISLMLSGVLYLLSGGEEEKVKKAKNWIIWALVGVITSSSAWFLVDLVNNFSF